MTTPLSRDSALTLTEQLVALLASRIEQRLLTPGSRLPSVRECARTHQVSPYTVVAAYDQLQARGLVEARSQRGYFVREGSERTARVASGQRRPTPPARPPFDATTLLRGMFNAPGQRAMPALGTLPATWLDGAMLGSALRKVTHGARVDALSLYYADALGDARLRQALTHRLDEIGLKVDPQQIITTVGGAHALDVVTRTLLQPGDAVLVDEPGWAAEFARLQLMGMRLLPVPRGPDGPDLQVLEHLARTHRPKLYVTVSVLHNPTSVMLSPGHAHQVLRLAEQHDFHILEDDIYAFLAPAHATRLSVLDELRRTITISSFSKALAPGWRVGYIVSPPALVDRFVGTKLLSTLSTAPVLEQALAHCMEQGQLRRHCERVITQLDGARARCLTLARASQCHFVTPPQGLFGWVDVGVDTERLAHPMLDAGWMIAPGALFHAERRPTTLMRINVATSQDADFWKALQAAVRRLRH